MLVYQNNLKFKKKKINFFLKIQVSQKYKLYLSLASNKDSALGVVLSTWLQKSPWAFFIH